MPQKSALIFYGGWEGHEPEACAKVIDTMLRNENFNTERVEGTDCLAREDLDRFDLIVPLCTQTTVEKDALDNPVAAIPAATGLCGFHGG